MLRVRYSPALKEHSLNGVTSFLLSLLRSGRLSPYSSMCSQCNLVLAIWVPRLFLTKCFRMGSTVPLIARERLWITGINQAAQEESWKDICQVTKQTWVGSFLSSIWALLYTLLEQKADLMQSSQFHVRWWRVNMTCTTLPVLYCCGCAWSLHVYNAAWRMSSGSSA